MADKNIGSLKKATYLGADSLLVAEQQGEAVAVEGSLFIGFARDAVTGYVGSAEAFASAASESAKAAGISAGAADVSAKAAATSAVSADTLAKAAASSESAAASSAKAADTSAKAAATSESTADASAKAAVASENAADTSAKAAATSAQAAVASEGAADTSAKAAAASESAADTSARAAESFSVTAERFANAAETSASNAQTARQAIENMSVTGVSVPPESSASVEKEVVDGSVKLTFSIPEGKQGKQGDPGYTPQKNVDYFDGAKGDPGYSGVYIGADTPPDNANVWINPNGKPTGTENWEFEMDTGATDTKMVVVIGSDTANGTLAMLRFKQGDKWVEIPAITGTDGKTAYQYAVEGGYVGSEEQFTAQLGAASSFLNEANGYTDAKIAELINGAPTTLDTLGEIATAMAENADVVEALNGAIGSKADAQTVADLTNVVAGKADAATVTALAETVTNKANASDLTAHTGNKDNPHGVTAAQVGAVPVIGGKAVQGTPSTDASTSSMNRLQSDLFVQGDGAAPNCPSVPGFYLGKSASDENRHMDIVSGGDYAYLDFNKASRNSVTQEIDYDARLLVNVTTGDIQLMWGGSPELTQKTFNVHGAIMQNGSPVALRSDIPSAVATTTANGLMSATDKATLDALAASAVSVLSGAAAPTADIGEDGDIYLVTEG